MPIRFWCGPDQHPGWRYVRRGWTVWLSIVIVLIMAGQLVACKDAREATAPISNFSDVADTHPFRADILKLAEKRITAGCQTGSYCPDAPVTGAQMALFSERLQHPTTPSDPNAVLTHAQMADFIVKMKGAAIATANTPSQTFCDVPPSHPLFRVIDYYANTLQAWPGCAVISGNERGDRAECNANCAEPPRKFCPDCPVTRGETAHILVRTFNL